VYVDVKVKRKVWRLVIGLQYLECEIAMRYARLQIQGRSYEKDSRSFEGWDADSPSSLLHYLSYL
jgi:hypothetical protein